AESTAPSTTFHLSSSREPSSPRIKTPKPSSTLQSAISKKVQIPVGSLNNWVRLARSGQPLPQSGNLTPETQEQRELRRLRQENEYLRRQREILKKALGILSAEMPRNDTP